MTLLNNMLIEFALTDFLSSLLGTQELSFFIGDNNITYYSLSAQDIHLMA